MLRIKMLTKKEIFHNANSDDSLVIIGKGSNNYKLRQVEYYSSKENVNSIYKNSELAKAFNYAFDFGLKNIFLINIQNTSDYIEIVDILKHYNFAYIVPLDIKMHDMFYHAELNKQITYAEYFLFSLKDMNSLIIMTDNHASLYEDIDDFLDDMKNKINNFKNSSTFSLDYGRNLCFVANNLKDSEHANLALACALICTSYDSYPDFDFGEAIFNIDYFDIRNLEMAYFKNNTLRNTTIENLKNFRKENDADKLVLIDKVIKYIERNLNLTQYEGKFFSEYIKLKIYDDLSKFLRSIKGNIISDYTINSVHFLKHNDYTGTIINDFSITPINSIEDFNVVMEL